MKEGRWVKKACRVPVNAVGGEISEKRWENVDRVNYPLPLPYQGEVHMTQNRSDKVRRESFYQNL